MLKKEGHVVFNAENGMEAVSLFQRERPDMVLMDVMMPVMDGYEATRRIKEICGERFVPVIFVTALTDDDALARCIECGGDDFLTKPINRIILRAKINALKRIHGLYRTLSAQKEQLELYREKTDEELHLAKHIFNAATNKGMSKVGAALQRWSMSVDHFSGDLFVYEYSPSGNLNLMVGDFTGHGLPSAVGALPAADIFYSMTLKGFSINDIAMEVNKKLKLYLPTGRFYAACLVSINFQEGRIEFWNGGLPPVLILDADGKVCRQIASNKLPLGILEDDKFDRRIDAVKLKQVAGMVLYTDGLIEARNAGGEMFGGARLEKVVTSGAPGPERFEKIKSSFQEFTGEQLLDDDVSLVYLETDGLSKQAASTMESRAASSLSQPGVDGSGWSFDFYLSGDKLKVMDPIPLLTDWLGQVGVPPEQNGPLCLVLGELVNNAIEHGILGLDSQLKETAEGFEEYYRQRTEGLQNLQSGHIRIHLEQASENGKAGIRVQVEDSGTGFNVDEVFSGLDGNRANFGRGIALVRSLCPRIDYLGAGNCVEAVYAIEK
jgi:serine phosphatase RsbU (regulator of sigma subunit)/anti-sigma regulatory factor (Ser/Thr protein kinase)